MGMTSESVQHKAEPTQLSPWPPFGVLVAITWLLDIGLHQSITDHRNVIAVLAAWFAMTAAMMTPTTVPMLNSLREILGNSSRETWWMFLAGYTIMWSAFSLLGGGLQIALSHTSALTDHGTLASRSVTAGVLALAGVYQFTPIKNMCRDLCLRPMTFFMAHWRSGIGCCWALMLLAFVGTASHWGFMALVTGIMVMEKMPKYGAKVTAPIGIALLVWAALLFFTPEAISLHNSH
jgi:predicted metal-binding membrane protein